MAPSERLRLRPGLAWLSVVAIFSLSLEVELLQQIDSLHLYLTAKEIAVEACVALLFTMFIASAWWLLVLILGRAATRMLRPSGFHILANWVLWIAIPVGYFVLDVFRDLKLEVFPHLHAGINSQILAALGVGAVCTFCILGIGCETVQRFCRTRLEAIAWVHIIIALAAGVGLWIYGVRLFHDYQGPIHAQAAPSSPDIYLITIDALRADDMSVYGYDRPTTPNLEGFSQRSFVFEHCFSNSNFTTTSALSIETGKLPWSHRVFQFGGFLRGEKQQENIAAELKKRGYYTAMTTANLFASPFRHRSLASYDAVKFALPRGLNGFRLRIFNLVGVNTQATLELSLLRSVKGFIAYLDRIIWGDRYPTPAEDTLRPSSDLLAQFHDTQPVFLWVHVLPPHDPYWVPSPFRHRFVSRPSADYKKFAVSPDGSLPPGATLTDLRGAYDEMIQYADHSVGEFLDWLDRTGRLDRSVVIITSDHGEMFEHGRLSHGGPDLYNGVIHIPLLIHLPGQKKGARIEELAQQADLLPTVLDLIAAPIPSWTDGASLKPLLSGRTLPDRYIFSMNLEPDRTFDPITKGTIAVMDSDFKFVRYLDAGKEHLYRYRDDPSEEHNLIDTEPEVAERMREVLSQKVKEVNQRFNGTR